MTIDNTGLGSNTYYLYIRGYPDSNDNYIPRAINTLLYATIPSSGCVYIFNESTWQKAIPYIYTGSGTGQGWKQVQVYIFNNSIWKKCGQ